MRTPATYQSAIRGLVALGLLSSIPGLTRAGDVAAYGVFKGKQYVQSSETAPLEADGLFVMRSFARMTATDALTEATVKPPGTAVTLPLTTGSDPLLKEIELPFLSLGDLDNTCPDGAYEFALATVHDGNRRVTLNLTGSTYPGTPVFSDFASLSYVNPAAPCTVTWGGFAGGTATDFIQLQILDSSARRVFSTPDLGAAGTLNGAAVSALIPANTLPPDDSFTACLLFLKVQARDTTSYAGATGMAGYFKRTETTLTTTHEGGTADATPPALLASVPANGASGVSLSSPVVFIFSEPMAAAKSIGWSANVNPADFMYDWSSDGEMLTCYYTGFLPANATITWSLNPASQPLAFKDAAGNPLPADVFSGGFTTTTNNPCYQGQDDGRGYGGVSKELAFVQTGPGAPAPDPTRPAMFLGSASSPTNNPLTSVHLQLPTGGPVELTNFFGGAFLAMEDYASQNALDAARPNGTYTLQLTRTNGATASYGIGLVGNYPPAPQILNYAAAQAVAANSDFQLQWNAFTGATDNDSILLSLSHGGWYWVAPDPCVPRALPNTATSFTIPSGTLLPNTTYHASLIYSRMTFLDTNAIPDMALAAFLRSALDFQVQTTGGGTKDRARFISCRILSGGNLELRLQGPPGATYAIEAASDLRTWSEVDRRTAPADGVIVLAFPPAPSAKRGFYRARTL